MRFEFSRLQAIRFGVSATVILIAVLVAWRLFIHYEYDPWTRDGRIKADIVQIASDVTGQVVKVHVRDNQMVKKGDILFEIDHDRFELALRQAQAGVQAARVNFDQAKREDMRNRKLKELVAHEIREQGRAKMEQYETDLAMAIVKRDTAKLDLERTKVRATVNGYVTNLNVQVGTYLSASQPAVALIDMDSLYVEGYFEETKLARIYPGDPATISLMGEEEKLKGYVQSVAGGIYDRERSTGSNLLQNINPTLNWVRLVQRIPVRIELETMPKQIKLVVGQTATINIQASNRSDRLGLENKK
ncbi:MAG: HlyD family secretion protein [Betaproteobacteria bacterium]|nr:HlyD family secretion protein [Betaproteobacteria bacterium]